MNVLVTGGTGLIGSQLAQALVSAGHQVIILSRQDKGRLKNTWPQYDFVQGLNEIGADRTIDVVVNLAGQPLFDRPWTQKFKAIIEQSRLDTTDTLVQWIKEREQKPKKILSGSAVGFYGDHHHRYIDEQSPGGNHFGAKLCQDWENIVFAAEHIGVSVSVLRTGIVLASQGGALPRMALPFKFALGTNFGQGKQFWPWIHIDDQIAAMMFLLDHETLEGPFNLTAPNPVSNGEFGDTLAEVLGRPKFLPGLPGWAARLMLGEAAELLLDSQRVMPQRLLEAGFQFKYPKLKPALEQLRAQGF